MVYYVTHPNLETTALIHAPATEKARTTFLDYLERGGQISRADRQYWRRNMVAEKMDDPYDVTADVELYYGYEEPRSMEASIGEGRPVDSWRQEYYNRDEIPPGGEMVEVSTRGPIEARVEEGHPVDSFEEVVKEERPTQKTIEDVAKETPRKLSPIAKKALEGYVE